jgi:hypothetical protein
MAAPETEQRELLGLFMAAVHVVLPDVTEEQWRLVGEIAERMLREWADGVDASIGRTKEGS